VDWRTFTILIAGLLVELRFNVNSAWVIAGGGMIGWLLR
jgi:hypothetical protein